MFIKPNQQVAFWLIVSAGLLATLIPGGPVENRNFFHIHPGILGLFNIFLTALDFAAVILAYYIIKHHHKALQGAYIAAIGFFTVYAVDLAQIFPTSPTPMSFALSLIEVLGITSAVLLMLAARRAIDMDSDRPPPTTRRTISMAMLSALLLVGITLVWFATDAAMHSDQPLSAAQITAMD